MDCTTLKEIFAGEREADLTEAESEAFEAHLNGCALCLQELAGAEDVLAPLTEWAPPEPSAEQWEQVTDRVRLEMDQPHGRVITPWTKTPLYIAFAAAALFVAGVTLLFVNQTDQPLQPSGGTAFINDDEPAPKEAVNLPGDGDEGTSSEPVSVDRPDSEILEHEAGDGFETEVVIYDGVPCVVIRERAS